MFSFLALIFVRILVYGSRIFRTMNVKVRLGQSGARLWDKMKPKENIHLFTDLEYIELTVLILFTVLKNIDQIYLNMIL